MKNYSLIIISIIVFNFIFSTFVYAGASKFYEDLDTGKCSHVVAGISNKTRMLNYAVKHANVWCQGSGGVSLGASTNDYTAATEGTGPYWCRIKGTIECNQ